MKEFRDRVLLPLAIPLVALAVIAFVVLNVSRILLALEETSSAEVATLVAIIVASTILFGSAYFAQQTGDRTSANVGALLMSGTLLVIGGVVGFAAVQEEHVEAEGPALEADVIARAFDIGWRETELTAPPGDVVVEMVNEGTGVHTFLIEGVGGLKLEVGSEGDTDIGQASGVAPGDYVFFCDVPGHRSAGMEGVLHVVEGAPGGGGEPTGGQEGDPAGGAEGGTEGQTGGDQSPAPEGGNQGGTQE